VTVEQRQRTGDELETQLLVRSVSWAHHTPGCGEGGRTCRFQLTVCLKGVDKQASKIIGRFGGWADYVRAQAPSSLPFPDNLDPAIAGPLMCPGCLNTDNPLRRTSGMKTAVLGVGGLGHLAVQFLAKFGTDVTAISSSHNKEGTPTRR